MNRLVQFSWIFIIFVTTAHIHCNSNPDSGGGGGTNGGGGGTSGGGGSGSGGSGGGSGGGGSGGGGSGGGGGGGGGGGHHASGHGNGGSGQGLTVVVSYEALNKETGPFFKNQLNSKTLQELEKCPIEWKFLPCGTSSIVNGHLTCWQGEKECAIDRVYACATKLNQGNMKGVGKFVMCMMAGGNDSSSGSKCATESNLQWSAIETCSKSANADKYCHEYWVQANQDWQITEIPGIMFAPHYDQNTSKKAAGDFKNVLCQQLKEKGASCDACGSSGGGGSCPGGQPGSGGGGHGGGGHGGGENGNEHGGPSSGGGPNGGGSHGGGPNGGGPNGGGPCGGGPSSGGPSGGGPSGK